jgi:protein-S-isoprenylcysteine O-methyltransferase Ste14
MPETLALVAVTILWGIFIVYWVASASSVKATRWREPILASLFYRIPMMIGASLLMVSRALPPDLNGRFVPASPIVNLVGLVLAVAGIAFAIWARVHLGSNWSARVTVKEEHSLVRTGPYRYVAHPIYSGIILGLLGTAVIFGLWSALVATGFFLAAFIIKSRVEEVRMRETFSEYAQYRAETPAIIPFIYQALGVNRRDLAE